jgi:hypothetical protein
VTFYTDKASHFQTAEKRKRDEPGVEQDAVAMPPAQIEGALRELGIGWSPAHSPQAKGRVERNFGTARDRLVKGMRVAGVTTIEQANEYGTYASVLANDYLAWWEGELTVEAANPDDAHRPLEKSHNLAASLSHVETRQVRNDYTLRFQGELHQIERQAITTGLRGANVRVEKRLDGALAVRFGEKYLAVKLCVPAQKKPSAPPPAKPCGALRAALTAPVRDARLNFLDEGMAGFVLALLRRRGLSYFAGDGTFLLCRDKLSLPYVTALCCPIDVAGRKAYNTGT